MSREGRHQSRCKSCRYFDSVSETHGLCKVESPRITSNGGAIWPWVTTHEWCGKHGPFLELVHGPLGAYMKPVAEEKEPVESHKRDGIQKNP